MAAIVATIEAMEDEKVVENAAAVGRDVLAPGLARLAETNPLVGEVRGSGVFWAVELVTDKATREPVPGSTVAAVKQAAMARGLIPFVSENRIHVVPPCVIAPDEAARGLEILGAALDEVAAR
jgi:taurine--2-oxoglutarate transaminase